MNATVNKEEHADLEHEIWSSWMKYMFSKGTFNDDGTWIMPAWAVSRWMRQASTQYCNLSHAEQQSDLEQVEKHIQVDNLHQIDRKDGTQKGGDS
jgi:hypothetical protein